MLNKFRRAFRPFFKRLGMYLARTGLPPIFWSSLGLTAAFFSSLAYSGIFFSDGFYGGLFLLVSGFADVLDGSVARATDSVSSRGAFIDSTFDRLGELFVFIGILIGGFSDPLLVIIALSLSLLVSYTRARGESLGIKLSGTGIGERAERILVLVVASMLGYVDYGVIIVLVLALITFLQRVALVIKAL
ncbi:MAG: CDP-alcohol phosphatidyltransferase family protein [Candidatus Methylarchaceae archaeon HK01B]|nr:CDP-alcohol phosphatidyltransferase family protein [Candidatus Methylarchaceae archaeon HK01M]MCP8311534.1 CDP-alcohol phosphatidyltransferase family protein [Candidatus Methylarchaceae archaeon HK02M1]MCP8319195.1 CDP-alcohol phosphatidyltransferase family protein [Candidatus Methylarchaceae archaeon HK01B]